MEGDRKVDSQDTANTNVQVFARKVMVLLGSEEAIFSREARLILATCNGTSQHVIKVLDVALMPSSPYYVIDMELAAFSLYDYVYCTDAFKRDHGLGQINVQAGVANKWNGVSEVICQIAAGLQHIHALSQIHGNLKATNGIPLSVIC
jgi:hypothetical protein